MSYNQSCWPKWRELIQAPLKLSYKAAIKHLPVYSKLTYCPSQGFISWFSFVISITTAQEFLFNHR